MDDEKILRYLPLVGIFLVVGMLIAFNSPFNSSETKEDPLKEIISKSSMSGAKSEANPQNVNNSTNNNVNSLPSGATTKIEESKNMSDKTKTPKFEQLIDTNKKYTAEVDTSKGKIKIRLFAKEAPKTVTNFVYLSKLNFYDGLIFHRVIPDFMIQGGDPLGTGTGGPSYKFEDEQSGKPLVQGSLAMANAGPNTNGSQFFIVTAKETPWLNGKHTNFGEVVEGMDVVMQISQVARDRQDRPVEKVVINSVTIIEE